MSRRLVALRLMLAAAAVSALAACASPTAPTSSRLKTPTLNNTGTDTTCRSGFTSGNGFHC
jgi:hypothetical protein